VPSYRAERELLASREDVWEFLAEPTRLADWWPGLQGVHADRRGLAPGARWRIQTRGKPNALVGPKFSVEATVVFIAVERPSHLSWQFIQDRYDVDLMLFATGPDRTRATLTVTAPMFSGLRRRLPYQALTRLYALCQTGAPTG
jgi:uncharacterized protein YndB with AHSA1/START domain